MPEPGYAGDDPPGFWGIVFGFVVPSRSYGLVIRKGRALSPAARFFVETSFPNIDVEQHRVGHRTTKRKSDS